MVSLLGTFNRERNSLPKFGGSGGRPTGRRTRKVLDNCIYDVTITSLGFYYKAPVFRPRAGAGKLVAVDQVGLGFLAREGRSGLVSVCQVSTPRASHSACNFCCFWVAAARSAFSAASVCAMTWARGARDISTRWHMERASTASAWATPSG